MQRKLNKFLWTAQQVFQIYDELSLTGTAHCVSITFVDFIRPFFLVLCVLLLHRHRLTLKKTFRSFSHLVLLFGNKNCDFYSERFTIQRKNGT